MLYFLVSRADAQLEGTAERKQERQTCQGLVSGINEEDEGDRENLHEAKSAKWESLAVTRQFFRP